MFRRQLQPLSEGDKALVVYGYLESLDALPQGIESWPKSQIINLMLGTPQYTLVNCLEVYFLYNRNSKFAKNLASLAKSHDIDIESFKGTPKFLVSLGFVFIYTRANLSENDRATIVNAWNNRYTDSAKPFLSEEDEVNSWVNDIVAVLQDYEAKQASPDDVLGEVDSYEEYLEQIEMAIEQNDDLLNWYTKQRSIG